jgi:hypothetical protein
LPPKIVELLLKQLVLAIGLRETLGNVGSGRDTGITFRESIRELRYKLSGFGLEPLVLGTLLGKDGCLM